MSIISLTREMYLSIGWITTPFGTNVHISAAVNPKIFRRHLIFHAEPLADENIWSKMCFDYTWWKLCSKWAKDFTAKGNPANKTCFYDSKSYEFISVSRWPRRPRIYPWKSLMYKHKRLKEILLKTKPPPENMMVSNQVLALNDESIYDKKVYILYVWRCKNEHVFLKLTVTKAQNSLQKLNSSVLRCFDEVLRMHGDSEDLFTRQCAGISHIFLQHHFYCNKSESDMLTTLLSTWMNSFN